MPPVPSPSLPFLTRSMLAFEQAVTFALRVDMQADTVATLSLRGMTREATFEYKATTAANSLITTATFALSDIPIMVTIEDTARALSQGSAFVTISLMANGVVVQQLVSGYLYAQKALSWPNTQQVDLRPGGGRLTAVSGPDPAAGISAEITVPAGEVWLLKNATVAFVTGAAVANRRVYIEINTPEGGLITAIAQTVHTASDAQFYTFAPQGNGVDAIANFDHQVSMPSDVWISAGGFIDFSAAAIQAADNFGTPTVYIEKFFTTP